MATVTGASYTAVSGCFSLGIPNLICACMAGIGGVTAIAGAISCIAICLTPLP